MRKFASFVSPLVGLAWLLGCAGTCSGVLAELDPAIDLTVKRVVQTGDLSEEGVEATTIERYVVIDVKVENTSANEDFAVQPSSFVLATASGVELDADDASALVPEPCDAGKTLTFGSTTTCTLVFEVARDDESVELILRTPEGREGRAVVDEPECDWCGNNCVDLTDDHENCGECGNILAEDEACEEGGPVCLDEGDTLCGDGCVDTLTDPNHCGACDVSVPPDHICDDGEPDCAERGLESCEDGCFDTDEDSEHCGACDQACPDEGDWCMNGDYCRNYEQTSDQSVTCDEICADVGPTYVCRQAFAYYGSYCAGDFDDEALLDCDELPADDNGYCTHFETLGCYCDHIF